MKHVIRVCLVLLVLSQVNLAQTVAVQGVLRDPAGRTVVDGSHTVVFKLYDAETGGSELWSESHGSVSTSHGVFSEKLGESSSMSALSFTNQYWLGIRVDDGTEISQRLPLQNSPAANAVSGASNIMPSTGNVGIGTKTPQSMLELNGATPYIGFDDTDGGSYWSLGNYGTSGLTITEGDDARFVIKEGGQVGIGTNDPSAALHVVGTAYIESSATFLDRIRLMRVNGPNYIDVSNASNFYVRTIGSDDSAPITSLVVEPAGDVGIGTEPTEKLEVAGNLKLSSGGLLIFPDGSSLASANLGGTASALASPDNTLITADASADGVGEIQFKTGTSTDMVITNERKVGIGTSTPSVHLEVAGSGVQRVRVTSSNDQAGISFESGGTGEYVMYTPGGSDDLLFYNGSSDVMGLTSAGNLGLGTINPADRLHVSGASYFEDRLRLMRTAGSNYIDFNSAQNFYLRSITTDDADANIRLAITPSGFVGIGTASPEYKLDLQASYSEWAGRFINNSNGASVYMSHGNGYGMSISPGANADASTYALKVYRGDGGLGIYARGDGNIGINSVIPDAKLSIDSDGDGSLFNVHTSHSTDSKIFEVSQSGSDGMVNVRSASGSNISQISGYSGTPTFFHSDVGLGTDNPTATLHLNKTSPYIKFTDTDGGSEWLMGNYGTNRFLIQENSIDRLVISEGGNVGIGTTSPVASLHVAGDAYLEDRLRLQRTDGPNYVDFNNGQHLMFRAIGTDDTGSAQVFELHADGSAWLAGGLSQNSDRRLKRDIQTVGSALDKIRQMRGVTYRWNRNQPGGRIPDNRLHYGFIAQEVEEIIPEIVAEGSNGYKTIQYSEVSSVLVEAIKEQQTLIETQQETIETLLDRLTQIETRLENSNR